MSEDPRETPDSTNDAGRAIRSVLFYAYGLDRDDPYWSGLGKYVASGHDEALADFEAAYAASDGDPRRNSLNATARLFGKPPVRSTEPTGVAMDTAPASRGSELEALLRKDSPADDDVCQFIDVTVDGIPAVYIYSSFTTRTPFAELSGWLNPLEWHERGPQLWDRVEEVDEAKNDTIGKFDVERRLIWEVASPRWEITKNYLTCDRAQLRGNPDFAILSYDLAPGRPRDVLVDHGYVSIAKVTDGVYAASFVKIIGFKDPEDNETVKRLRPIWISLLRTVAEGSQGESAEVSRAEGDQPVGSKAEVNAGTVVAQWVNAAGSIVTEYGQLIGDFLQRFTGPSLGWDQYRDLVSTYWEGVIDKYAGAWSTTQGVLSQMGQASDKPTRAMAFSRAHGPSVATSWVPTPVAGGSIAISDLQSIVRDTNASIPGARIRTDFDSIGDDHVIEIAADTTGLPRGVYVGTAEVTAKLKAATVPVYLFVSGAVPA